MAKCYFLELTKLPFKPDARQIIYTEGKHDEGVNNLIRTNYQRIRKEFAEWGYVFCYIPILKHDLVSEEHLHYNAPYAKSAMDADFAMDDNFILDYMLRPENREKIPPSLMFYDPMCQYEKSTWAEYMFKGVVISEASFDGDEGLTSVLAEIRQFAIEGHDDTGKTLYRMGDGDVRFSISGPQKKPDIATEDIDGESIAIIREIEDRIEKLRQRGVDKTIIESLFRNHQQKLSRLQVTKDYRILLPDYSGMEIRMTPLPKAVYLLYLRHPEGIMFSYLPDYREELMEIYKSLKGDLFNREVAEASIEDVTNPLSNSINEKCSRIRQAFVSQFDESLARYYYVEGERGEAKRILLDRTLVEWE